MLHILRQSLLLTLGGLTLALTSPAQNPPLPDGLDAGPCDELAFLVLPDFPTFEQDSLQICWKNCSVEKTQTLRAKWRITSHSIAGRRTPDMRGRLTIKDSQETVLWKGRMTMTYSRTWLEDQLPSGETLQVWRFLVNGDLRPTQAAGGSPVFVPTCAAECDNNVRYTGYVDWVRNLSTGKWENAWMLTHSLGKYEHYQGYPRDNIEVVDTHEDRVNCFVGPAAGFVPLAMTPHALPVQSTTQEALRKTRVKFFDVPSHLGGAHQGNGRLLMISQGEESITGFQTGGSAPFCACKLGGNDPQFTTGTLSITGTCGTNISTGSPSNPYNPPFGGYYLSMGIGMWTDVATYPGMEFLRWNMGFYDFMDLDGSQDQKEVFYGVTTLRGYVATALTEDGPGIKLDPGFIDQCNSLWLGGKPTWNIRFRSDHILNLNAPPAPPK